ncbi:MAG: CoA transferase, partial [Beijerinckiaceae bacterium]|nr:CoA transferase [Beijerinckiaceae bacterium]
EIQGPYATLMLADMGAEVIKIENRATGDLARRTTVGRIAGPDAPHATFQQYFLVLNRGKRSVTLDLKKDEGKAVFHRLLEQADVLLTNFRPGVLDRLGFGYDAVHVEFPRLIYAVASSWGPEGPWALRPSRDLLAQAASGMMSKTGEEGAPPLPAGSIVADYSGAQMAAMGVLAALYARERTGLGQRVDTSMYGTLIAMQPWEIAQTSLTGVENRRAGRGTQFLHGVWGAFRTADGWIAIAGVDEDRWDIFCRLIDRPDLIEDPECDNEWRNFRGDKIQAILDETLPRRTTAAWMERFGPNDIFATPVAGYLDVLTSEQALTNRYVREFDHPETGPIRLAGNPIKLSDCPMREFAPAPGHGADTADILHELGYSDDEIEMLRVAEAV